MTLSTINQQFAIPEHISFSEGPGGFIFADIHNDQASSRLCLNGGHITAYQPSNQPPVIWLSKQALFQSGKAIRGGVPICWPWFGDHPSEADKPAHGIARTAAWSVILTEQPNADESLIQLQLRDSAASKQIWPHAFELILSVRVGKALVIELIAKNTDNHAMDLSAALHTYFHIGHVDRTTITGLEDTRYIDKFDAGKEKPQQGSLRITSPTDRVYFNTDRACTIIDEGLQRQIQIKKTGSQTTVVWNPWQENAAKMGDFGDDEYPSMVCVEAANALQDTVCLAPGESHTLSQTIQVLRL